MSEKRLIEYGERCPQCGRFIEVGEGYTVPLNIEEPLDFAACCDEKCGDDWVAKLDAQTTETP